MSGTYHYDVIIKSHIVSVLCVFVLERFLNVAKHLQCLILVLLHYFPLALALVVDSHEVQHAVNHHAHKLLIVIFAE